MIERFRYEKFLNRLLPDGECIVFAGSKSGAGYGSLQGVGKRILAHRLSYQIFVGPLIERLVIDHICRNRACVRPDHLRQVTHQENILAGTGATARHAAKTHCANGHEFTPENTYRDSKGRRCISCRNEKKKAWDLKNREHILEYRRRKWREKMAEQAG